ncbi:hypothetical protein ACIP3A_39700 [Streptomyces tricolor]|uniref:hypothetical protein n=1 Tax=Streptomyces TaxID=1883 RepID=UPI001AD7F8C6|nr:hypothetical protein [Streptomyces sp. PBH53]
MRRMLPRRLGGWIAVAASLAGILTAVFLVKDRYFQPPFTPADWKKEANAVCDQHYTELIAAINRSRDSLYALNSAADKIGQPSGPSFEEVKPLLSKAANDLDVLSGRERLIAQDFDKLKRPEGRKREVENLIKAIREVSQTDADFAADTHRAIEGSGDGRTYDQYIELRDRQVVKVREYLQRCLA